MVFSILLVSLKYQLLATNGLRANFTNISIFYFQWDLRSLEKPKISGYYKHPNKVSIKPLEASSTESANKQ